jgi:hypothetical protein
MRDNTQCTESERRLAIGRLLARFDTANRVRKDVLLGFLQRKWPAPIFCTRGYESMGWVTGNVSASCLCRDWSAGAAGAEIAAQPAANAEGVW